MCSESLLMGPRLSHQSVKGRMELNLSPVWVSAEGRDLGKEYGAADPARATFPRREALGGEGYMVQLKIPRL